MYNQKTYPTSDDMEYVCVTMDLSQRTFGHAFFCIAGTYLGDGVAELQTFAELVGSDLTLGHNVQLGTQAVITIRIGQHITGSPLTGYGIQRNVCACAAVDFNGDRFFCLQSLHGAGIDALPAAFAGLVLDGVGQNRITFQNGVCNNADEPLVDTVFFGVQAAGICQLTKPCCRCFKGLYQQNRYLRQHYLHSCLY